MRIAVPYQNNGDIFRHFGECKKLKLYDVEDGIIVGTGVMSSMGLEDGDLAEFLSKCSVNVLICGGIGAGSKEIILGEELELYGGVSGNADRAVKAFLAGTLEYNPNLKCEFYEKHVNEEGRYCNSCNKKCKVADV